MGGKRIIQYYLFNTEITALSLATTLSSQSKFDLASNAAAHRHMRLHRLSLTDFRNYAALTWRPTARISVLFGPNGSGKTNLLEAVSLLVPGRGLRGARNADLPRHGGSGRWAASTSAASPGPPGCAPPNRYG